MPKRSPTMACSARRTPWQSSPGATSTCAASAGKPEVTSQTCRSWTSTTPGHGGQRVADRLRVDALGRALEQHAAGVAQQQPARAQHQRGDEQRGDGVGAIEAREEHDRAGGRGGERREEVGEHVRAGALDVERAPLGLAQRGSRAPTFAHAPTQADDEHEAAVDVGDGPQAPDRLDGDDARQHEQRRAVGLGGEDLGAAEAEGEAPGRRARGQPGRVEREPIAAASVSMCAASESSASESARMPATTSTTMKVAMTPSATASQRRSASAAGPWW